MLAVHIGRFPYHSATESRISRSCHSCPGYQCFRLFISLICSDLADTASPIVYAVRIWEMGGRDCSTASIRRLAAYYRRMGFERSRPRERFRDDGAVLMHALIGESPLPFGGLGGMGKSK